MIFTSRRPGANTMPRAALRAASSSALRVAPFVIFRLAISRMAAARLPMVALLLATLLPLFAPPAARADEPYARTKDYDLASIRTHLWFDLGQRKIRGE